MKADEKKCPKCAEPVKAEASVCRHCGYEFSAEELAAEKARRDKQNTRGAIGCGVLILLILLFVGMCSQGDGEEADENAVSTDVPSKTVPVDEDAKASFLAMYRKILTLAKPCDDAVGELGKVASAGDAYSTYRTANEGHEVCRQAAMSIADMDAPAGISADQRKPVEKALEVCRDAYLFRQSAMEKAMRVADGDGRPSVVAGASDDLKSAQAGVLLCVANLYDASGKMGVDPKEMQGS